MKPEVVKRISPELALEMMNEIVYIHNMLMKEDQYYGNYFEKTAEYGF